MAGRPKSESKKVQIEHNKKHELEDKAVAIYLDEMKKPEKERKGARAVAQEATEAHFHQTGEIINICHNTILRRAKGGKSVVEFNGSKGHLRPEEVNKLIEVAEELSDRNIPMTHTTLGQYAEVIIRARDPKFVGLGRNWTNRLVEKHSDRIKPFFSSPLDASRTRAVNPNTHAAWFNLLKTLFSKYGHGDDPDCLYALDETGFMPGRAITQKVIGRAGNKGQSQKESGNRELITVLPAICADGSALPPLVIHAGKAYSVSWKQNNPLEASLGYSQKGYIDGELLAEWIKHFDQFTKRKARGRPRYIFLDSHLSRLHLPFLLYCRENNIHAVCYPSHSTHIYQGLDVVVFSVLKRFFTEEMLKHEAQTGTKVDKSNFIEVYTPAHIRAFNKGNIQMAFAKTGIYPFNPEAISPTLMKPSVESSTTGDGLPLVPPTPVRTVARLLTNVGPQSQTSTSLPVSSEVFAEVQQTRNELQASSAGFLVGPSPIKHSSVLPVHATSLNVPFVIPEEILSKVPETELEEQLQDSLMEVVRREARQYGTIATLQASMVLQSIYCERLRSQLHAQESKATKKKGSGKLLGDGLPRCLTADEFFSKVQEFTEKQAQEELEKARRIEERGQHASALAIWKQLNKERKSREDARTKEFAAELKMWKEEQLLARVEKRKPRWLKPKRGPHEPAIPRPTKPSAAEDDLEEIDINVNNGSDDSDADSDT